MSTTKQDLDNLLQQYVTSKNGPAGCACAVAKDGEVLYEGYAGYANLEKGQKIDKDTIYRLYSMTKVIVCTAGMMLFERGKFLMQDPLYEYFPEYKNTQKVVYNGNGTYRIVPVEHPITVKDVFTMRCGLPYPCLDHPTDQAMIRIREKLAQEKPNYTLRDDIRAMADVPVAFEPGTHWMYGFGHDLVAGLVQELSGKKISEFLQEEIFDPLGMKSTAYRFRDNFADRMARIYEIGEDGSKKDVSELRDKNHQPDAAYEGGGAGLMSTVGDYLTFTQMLANGGVLNGEHIISRKTIDLMRRNQLNEVQLKDFQNTYNGGYGWGLCGRTLVDPADGNNPADVGEFGWTGVGGTYTSIDPAEHFSVVYMHQTVPNNEEYHHLRVRNTAYGLIK